MTGFIRIAPLLLPAVLVTFVILRTLRQRRRRRTRESRPKTTPDADWVDFAGARSGSLPKGNCKPDAAPLPLASHGDGAGNGRHCLDDWSASLSDTGICDGDSVECDFGD